MSWPEKPNLKHTARLFCKPASKAYVDNWDAVFGKKKGRKTIDGLAFLKCHPAEGDFWVCTSCKRYLSNDEMDNGPRCPDCDVPHYRRHKDDPI